MENIELYVHIPFCAKKCSYCDFVSFGANNDTINQYIEALLCEIKNKSFMAHNYIVSSIFIGGGTPSFIDEDNIIKILDSIYKNYVCANDIEITIELNPHSTIKTKLNAYHSIGINRLSFGLQSTNENELKALGRLHTYNDFLICYNDARTIGFKNINIDIINGIPYETPQSYEKCLQNILALSPTHLSIYNLIIEENTPFYKLHQQHKLNLPNENDMEKIDNLTTTLLTKAHFHQYEISNYARNGFECKHNLGYWSNISYLGFGLNSSSYYKNKRYKNKTDFTEYLSLNYNNYPHTNDTPYEFYDNIDILTKKELMSEYIILGLRKVIGIDINEFNRLFNVSIYDIYRDVLNKYISLNLLTQNNSHLYFTDRGRNLSNIILSEFI